MKSKSLFLEIDNSKESAVQDGKWKNPGAKLYDLLLNALDAKMEQEAPTPRELADDASKWVGWRDLLKETYLVAPVDHIKNSPHGVTPYSRSGCKYPHHVIRSGKLVLSVPGVKAAYARACQMGEFKGDIKKHLMRHLEELGLESYIHEAESFDKIESNFNDICQFISEQLGIDLEEPDYGSMINESVKSFDEAMEVLTPPTEETIENLPLEEYTDDELIESLEESFNELYDIIEHYDSYYTEAVDEADNKKKFLDRWKYDPKTGTIEHENRKYKMDVNTDIDTFEFKYKFPRLLGGEVSLKSKKDLAAAYRTSTGPVVVVNKDFWQYEPDVQDVIILHELGHIVYQMTPKPFPKSIRELIDRIKKMIQRLIARIRMRKYRRGIHGRPSHEIEADMYALQRSSPESMKKMLDTIYAQDYQAQLNSPDCKKKLAEMLSDKHVREMYAKFKDKDKYTYEQFRAMYIKYCTEEVPKQYIAKRLENNPDRVQRIKAIQDKKLANSKYFRKESTDILSENIFTDDDEFSEYKAESASKELSPEEIKELDKKNDEKLVPIYGIIKSYSHDKLRNDGSMKNQSELNSIKFDKIIHALTRGDNYSHALVSFDDTLTHMYSFEDEGFVEDNIETKLSWMGTKSIYICVMFVRESDKKQMESFVKKLKEHQNETAYASVNLLKAFVGRPIKNDKRFVCSSFTGFILSCSNPKNLHRDYSRLRPEDITLLPRSFYLMNVKDAADFKAKRQEIKDKVKAIFDEYRDEIEDYNNHLPKLLLRDRVDKLKTLDKILDWIIYRI